MRTQRSVPARSAHPSIALHTICASLYLVGLVNTARCPQFFAALRNSPHLPSLYAFVLQGQRSSAQEPALGPAEPGRPAREPPGSLLKDDGWLQRPVSLSGPMEGEYMGEGPQSIPEDGLGGVGGVGKSLDLSSEGQQARRRHALAALSRKRLEVRRSLQTPGD